MADKTDDVQAAIAEECDAIKELLLEKNRAYGNSALDPVRIFSKADAIEQIKVRIDDKLSRLARGSSAGEDVELDLLGYLVLLRVARATAAQAAQAAQAARLRARQVVGAEGRIEALRAALNTIAWGNIATKASPTADRYLDIAQKALAADDVAARDAVEVPPALHAAVTEQRARRARGGEV